MTLIIETNQPHTSERHHHLVMSRERAPKNSTNHGKTRPTPANLVLWPRSARSTGRLSEANAFGVRLTGSAGSMKEPSLPPSARNSLSDSQKLKPQKRDEKA